MRSKFLLKVPVSNCYYCKYKLILFINRSCYFTGQVSPKTEEKRLHEGNNVAVSPAGSGLHHSWILLHFQKYKIFSQGSHYITSTVSTAVMYAQLSIPSLNLKLDIWQPFTKFFAKFLEV